MKKLEEERKNLTLRRKILPNFQGKMTTELVHLLSPCEDDQWLA
jgi:hypothetical protein